MWLCLGVCLCPMKQAHRLAAWTLSLSLSLFTMACGSEGGGLPIVDTSDGGADAGVQPEDAGVELCGGIVCGADASCSTTDGEERCVCNPGFTGDGFVCEDVDECSNGEAD